MRVSVLQSALSWENKHANLGKLEEMAKTVYGKTDLLILPEMFNTGFTMNIKSMCEPENGPTHLWMERIAESGGFAICGSYIVNVNESSFNRFVFVTPGKSTFHYNKRHLFSMGEEDRYFTAGTERIVFRYNEFRVCPFVCYDLRFPVWSRNLNDYDLAIYAANWPVARINVWDTLLMARAIENQCYVAGTNITGTDGNGITYNGHSQIIGPKGEIITSANAHEEVLTADLSIDSLSEFRNRFSVLRDADNFYINL